MKKIKKILKKYSEVYKHSCSVRDLATDFSLYLGYSPDEVNKIRMGAYIHDIGKSFIAKEVLLKEGKLTNEEYEEVKKHSAIGYAYLKNCNLDDDVMAIVLQHHERMDGKGYPYGLRGSDIHQYAKIVSLCDVYDAITSNRSYKVAYSHYYAVSVIEKGLGTQFDKELGEKFLSFLKTTNLSNEEELSNEAVL